MKRLASLLLCLVVLIISVSPGVFAADSNVTIGDTEYRLLDVWDIMEKSWDDGVDNVVQWLVDHGWLEYVRSTGSGGGSRGGGAGIKAAYYNASYSLDVITNEERLESYLTFYKNYAGYDYYLLHNSVTGMIYKWYSGSYEYSANLTSYPIFNTCYYNDNSVFFKLTDAYKDFAVIYTVLPTSLVKPSESYGTGYYSLEITQLNSTSGKFQVFYNSLSSYVNIYNEQAPYLVASSIAAPSTYQFKLKVLASTTDLVDVYSNCKVLVRYAEISEPDEYLNINQEPYSRFSNISADYIYQDGEGNSQVFSDTQIINENDGTLYNPITNTTYDMTGWTYDYSTQTYYTTTNEGDYIVTYGDEYTTITNNNQTYNYYYAMPEDEASEYFGDDSGSGSDDDDDDSDDDDSDSDSFWSALGDLLGGLIDIIMKPLTLLIDLISGIVQNLADAINIAPEFTESMTGLWGIFPAEITSVIIAGATIVIMLGIIKMFLK